MGPQMMALAALGRVPEMRHRFGTYFRPRVGPSEDPQLVRDDEKAHGVIDAMGRSAGVLMRGNGAVTAGASLQEAVVLAWYLEDMCRVESLALSTGLSERIRPVSLELGGKNPAIVFDDADMEKTIDGFGRSCFANAGG
ncbi:aldehyde dehydrogenase family protein [Lutibaculum baratangense]|nr:aldehyde dehydrogenase family protein [Lutibaculum baratangense]